MRAEIDVRRSSEELAYQLGVSSSSELPSGITALALHSPDAVAFWDSLGAFVSGELPCNVENILDVSG